MITINILDSIKDLDNIIKELMNTSQNKKYVNVVFPSGETKRTTIKNLIVNLFIFEILIKWKLPFNDFIIKKSDILEKSLFEKILLNIYYQVLEKYKDYNIIYDQFSEDVWNLMNKLFNFIILNCNAYTKSINLIDIIKLVKDPDFRKALDLDNWKPEEWPIKEVEKREKQLKKKLINYLKTQPNPFRPFIRMGMINETQLFNLLISVGFKTDIDDRIIPKYISKSYLEGIDSNIDYVLESLAAKKSTFYNKSGIKNARYSERKIQLVLMSVRNTYPGDCGSKLRIPFLITVNNYKNMIGKIIEEDGKEIILNDDNISDYIDTVVNMRSPLTCKYSDGVCEKCGGLMTYFFPRRFNIGLVSAINVVEKVSQRILSAKHYQQTYALEWKSGIVSSLFEYLTVRNNLLYLTPKGKKSQFLVDTNIVKTIINMPYLKFEYINEYNLIPISEITIYENGQYKEGPINLNCYDIKPTFTIDFIKYFIENKDAIQVLNEKMTLINPDKFDIKKPFMRIDVFNDSMVAFVKNVEKFFDSQIKEYTDIVKALKDCTELIFSKVQVNIMFVEIILKAFLITDEDNYSIPVVDNLTDVKFSTIEDINLKRTLGQFLSFEQHTGMIAKPEFYLNFREPSDYDHFLLLEPVEDINRILNLTRN